MATNLVGKPLTKVKCITWSKVMQGSAGVNQRSNGLEMPYGHKIGRCNTLLGLKVMQG